MITENILKCHHNQQGKQYLQAKIIKETSQHIDINCAQKCMIFKTYLISPHQHNLQHIEQRYQLKHPGLINMYKVEFGALDKQREGESSSMTCGILFEKYVKNLGENVKEMISFTHEEIIETFVPIKEVVDYLVLNHYDPGEITYNSIVCTVNYQIKLLENYFQKQQINFSKRDHFEIKIYEELALLIFSLLFPHERHIKSWKCRYQIFERQLSKQHFEFVEQVIKGFRPLINKNKKSKIIVKANKSSKHKKIIIKQNKAKVLQFQKHNQNVIPLAKSYEQIINLQCKKENIKIQ